MLQRLFSENVVTVKYFSRKTCIYRCNISEGSNGKKMLHRLGYDLQDLRPHASRAARRSYRYNIWDFLNCCNVSKCRNVRRCNI